MKSMALVFASIVLATLTAQGDDGGGRTVQCQGKTNSGKTLTVKFCQDLAPKIHADDPSLYVLATCGGTQVEVTKQEWVKRKWQKPNGKLSLTKKWFYDTTTRELDLDVTSSVQVLEDSDFYFLSQGSPEVSLDGNNAKDHKTVTLNVFDGPSQMTIDLAEEGWNGYDFANAWCSLTEVENN